MAFFFFLCRMSLTGGKSSPRARSLETRSPHALCVNLYWQEKRDAAPGIPWEKGARAAAGAAADEISIGSSNFFAEDVAAGLSALRKDG